MISSLGASAWRCSRRKNVDLIRRRCIIDVQQPNYNYTASILSSHATTNARYNYNARCYYFTNTDQMKKSDPFAQLGLEWGATATEIKEAYRKLARELHPDVSNLEPDVALNKFRVVKEAYDKLMNNNNSGGMHRTDLWEEWSFQIWRNGDLIAQDRTDVAGTMRKRPVKPAESIKGKWGVASLGHPDGRGVSSASRRAEYLEDSGRGGNKRTSAVGRGQSKWVKPKEFTPWKPEEGRLMKDISQRSRRRKNGQTADGSSRWK